MFKNPFSFNGRIRRTEYGISYLIYLAVYIITLVFDDDEPSLSVAGTLLVLIFAVVYFLLAQGAKRCHDLGKSGWWQIIPFYFFWLIFSDGQEGENQYGPDPKGRTRLEDYDFTTNANAEPDGLNTPSEE